MREHKGHSEERSAAKARWLGIAAAAGIVISASTPAAAQTPPPPPPPGFDGAQGQPPPPPPGYGAAYGQPPPAGYYAPQGTAIMGPKVLDWDEGEPLRPGYHADTRIRKGLVIGGAVTFGVTYLITALVGAIAQDVSDSSKTAPLFVPAIGPFIAAGTVDHPGATGAFFLVLDGLVQSAGVAMFIVGLAAPRTVQVRNDVGAVVPQKKDAKLFLTPAPMTFGAHSGGFGLVGKF